MSLLSKIRGISGKASIQEIVSTIGQDKQLFDELMDLFLNGEYRTVQLSSWVVGHMGEKSPHLFKPYHRKMINYLNDDTCHDAVHRNIARVYQSIEIPEELEGELYDICFKRMNQFQNAIAIRVFCMSVCARIVRRYPDLIPEYVSAIEAQMEFAKPAFLSRGRKLLKEFA